MPKVRVLSGREVCKILAQHGFENVRQKGSHIIMQKQVENSTITVPVPDYDELSRDIIGYHQTVRITALVI